MAAWARSCISRCPKRSRNSPRRMTHRSHGTPPSSLTHTHAADGQANQHNTTEHTQHENRAPAARDDRYVCTQVIHQLNCRIEDADWKAQSVHATHEQNLALLAEQAAEKIRDARDAGREEGAAAATEAHQTSWLKAEQEHLALRTQAQAQLQTIQSELVAARQRADSADKQLAVQAAQLQGSRDEFEVATAAFEAEIARRRQTDAAEAAEAAAAATAAAAAAGAAAAATTAEMERKNQQLKGKDERIAALEAAAAATIEMAATGANAGVVKEAE